MTIRELEIIKAALQGDIIRQKNSLNSHKEDFINWLSDTEKLLKKVTLKIFEEKSKS